MRSFLLLSLSAAVLGGCLTTQENPNYELSTKYKGDSVEQNQYASVAPVAPTSVNYDNTYQTPSHDATYAQPTYTGAYAQPSIAQAVPVQPNTAVNATAPTDALYGQREVSGTPGFMAFESERQSVAIEAAAPTLPAAQIVTTAPVTYAGTPVEYDYSRNIIAADAVTTGQHIPETVRIQQGAGHNYTVRQGDTVYSLSRKTCVGVNVIQSMNGLNGDFGIKIGQSLKLPASVC